MATKKDAQQLTVVIKWCEERMRILRGDIRQLRDLKEEAKKDLKDLRTP